MNIDLGDRKIGAGRKCFVIAEAGVNHNGSLSMAHQLIDAAADAGADSVKFQTWITERICRPGARKADYQLERTGAETDQFEMLKRLELPYAWHAELQKHARDRNLIFLSTPDDIESATFLASLRVPAIKIGSGEVTNPGFLRALASLGLPLLLSTGMSTLDDVRNALAAIGDVPVALLHCVSAYPAPEEEMNLRAIVTMRDTFQVPVGLSDHTTGDTAALLSIALGAALLEKHITLDRDLEGPDHAASASPEQFRRLVERVRHAETMLGSGIKDIAPSECGTREAVLRTLHYAHGLPAGHVIAEGDLLALRAGGAGIPAAELARIAGKRLERAVNEGDPVADADCS